MNPFQSLSDYERFIYTLQRRFPRILRSTLTLIRRGRLLAELSGEIMFDNGRRLLIYERLSWETGPLQIEGYSREVWHGGQISYWYDSQPHPNDPLLAGTAPHHKHVPPDIKHHRVPAPALTLTAPNLPFLIEEIEAGDSTDIE
ncbi:MAG: DUF6516 family protein [Acidobacteriota bacterium]